MRYDSILFETEKKDSSLESIKFLLFFLFFMYLNKLKGSIFMERVSFCSKGLIELFSLFKYMDKRFYCSKNVQGFFFYGATGLEIPNLEGILSHLIFRIRTWFVGKKESTYWGLLPETIGNSWPKTYKNEGFWYGAS